MGLGMGALSLDLSDTNSLAEAQQRIAAYAAANPTPRWIVGRGWNQERWGLGRFPTAADLDAAGRRPAGLARAGRRPCRLGQQRGDARGRNHRRRPRRPQGGRIERTGRNPNGIFVDAAMPLVERAIPPPLPVQRDRALARAQEILLSNGLTSVADMGTSGEDWAVMRRAGDAGRLHVRILSYASGIDNLLAVAGTRPTPWLYDGRLRMVGVKLYLDGALGSRGAWLKPPYRDAPGQRGLPLVTDTVLKNLMSRAAMDDFQVAVHAIGDQANALLLDAIEELADTYQGDRRWRIEHAQIVDPADLPRFARHGTIASMQPVHQTSDWLMAEARMGIERLRRRLCLAHDDRQQCAARLRLRFPGRKPQPLPRPRRRDQPRGCAGPAAGRLAARAAADARRRPSPPSPAARLMRASPRTGSARSSRADKPTSSSSTATSSRSTDQREIRDTQVLETYVGGQKVWERRRAGAQSR